MERNETVLVDAVEDLADETNRVVVFTRNIEGNETDGDVIQENIQTEVSKIGGDSMFSRLMLCIETFAAVDAQIADLSALLQDQHIEYEQVADSPFWFKSFLKASPVVKSKRLMHQYAVFRKLYTSESKVIRALL